jgi:hypothetical protein
VLQTPAINAGLPHSRAVANVQGIRVLSTYRRADGTSGVAVDVALAYGAINLQGRKADRDSVGRIEAEGGNSPSQLKQDVGRNGKRIAPRRDGGGLGSSSSALHAK